MARPGVTSGPPSSTPADGRRSPNSASTTSGTPAPRAHHARPEPQGGAGDPRPPRVQYDPPLRAPEPRSPARGGRRARKISGALQHKNRHKVVNSTPRRSQVREKPGWLRGRATDSY